MNHELPDVKMDLEKAEEPDIKLPTSTAAAKLLQSCPTLCDPTDGSPPGSPVPGVLQVQHPLDHQKNKGVPEKHVLLLY